MSKASELIASFAASVRKAWVDAQGKLEYSPQKPPAYIVGQSGIANLVQPYSAPWYQVPSQGVIFAIPCLCSEPTIVVGVALRPYKFQSPEGVITLQLAQCHYCQRIYWSVR